jgi:hypothetical protein
MEKQNAVQRPLGIPWLIIGILSLLVLAGVSGCGTSQAASTQPTNQEQNDQGQRTINPAMQAAMEIRRLQNSGDNALSSDQKDTIKPILQELISTTSPTQDFLQQKADAINAVLTDNQKSFLAARPDSQGDNPNRDNPDTNNSNENNQNSNSPGGNTQHGGPDGNKQAGPPNTQAVYQEVLDSLE